MFGVRHLALLLMIEEEALESWCWGQETVKINEDFIYILRSWPRCFVHFQCLYDNRCAELQELHSPKLLFSSLCYFLSECASLTSCQFQLLSKKDSYFRQARFCPFLHLIVFPVVLDAVGLTTESDHTLALKLH